MALRTRKAQQVQNTPKIIAPITPALTKSANNDQLVNTIRRAFQEEFKVHKRKINYMIESNVKLTKGTV